MFLLSPFVGRMRLVCASSTPYFFSRLTLPRLIANAHFVLQRIADKENKPSMFAGAHHAAQ